ncbi:AraC family transcriptional regulator [Xylophilus sp. GOD-11R]|uniref:helix-turn-helix transcriptional regulator n=1 Tax=Xylophilus sp. GOD-11R TaxID=3089814 RepID=UPI00298CBDDF|nr:AraC family transcriptional regulator [Xylophilus sp. GOD-11R]WPB58266.1 AraC family transcriptional regulator [Xylophilus sp. GOD-11R]
MADPLADFVALLQPRMHYTKVAGAAGEWGVCCPESGEPMFLVMLEGVVDMRVGGMETLPLETGDFVLIPSSLPFVMTSRGHPRPEQFFPDPVRLPNGEMRCGDPQAEPDARMLVGHCKLGSPDAALLLSLLPRLIHIREQARLSTLMRLVVDESRSQRPARDVAMDHLLKLLFIEALRSPGDAVASPGLLRGLSDERLSQALRSFHEAPDRCWTVPLLAERAAMSRSSFFERFLRFVGVPPMQYVLAWRMALAKSLLKHGAAQIAEVAAQVGYSSASTFTVAFTRHVGVPPGRFARLPAAEA